MNSREHETLSAMLDNEADELELRRLLKNADQDPALLAAWERMSLVQAVLHDENMKVSGSMPITGNSFSESIARAIAQEAQPQTEQVPSRQWSGGLAKLAIAASVAVAFFLGMQTSVNSRSGSAGAVPMASQDQGDQPATRAGGLSQGDTRALADAGNADSVSRQVDPAARERLEEYIRGVSITREEPQQLEHLEDSPLYRLVNQIQDSQ